MIPVVRHPAYLVVDELEEVVEEGDVSEGAVVDAVLPEGIEVSVEGVAGGVVDGEAVVVGGVVTVVVVVEFGTALAPELL